MSLVVINEAYFSLLLNKLPAIDQQIHYLKFLEKCYQSVCLAKSFTSDEKQNIDSVIETQKFSLHQNFSKKKTIFVNLDKTLVISSL